MIRIHLIIRRLLGVKLCANDSRLHYSYSRLEVLQILTVP